MQAPPGTQVLPRGPSSSPCTRLLPFLGCHQERGAGAASELGAVMKGQMQTREWAPPRTHFAEGQSARTCPASVACTPLAGSLTLEQHPCHAGRGQDEGKAGVWVCARHFCAGEGPASLSGLVGDQ